MKLTVLALLVTTYGFGIAPVLAGADGDGPAANTFFTQIPGVIAVDPLPALDVAGRAPAREDARATGYLTLEQPSAAAVPQRR